MDDTLYKRDDYVVNGLINVAKLICSKNFSNQQHVVFKRLKEIYYSKDIEYAFDFYLKEKKIKFPNSRKCISVYRYGKNNIKAYSDALSLLRLLKKKCYLVTDGNKRVQKYKIHNLDIKKFFKKIFITNVYGIKFQKPSLYCFKKIKKIENINFRDMVYIGDNPNKDFVNCNKAGMITVRLLKGEFKSVKKKYPYDAKIKINKLSEIKKIFKL